MRRRHLLATLGGTVALGAGTLSVRPWQSSNDSTEPITVETLDAPGSEAGRVTVPPSDGPLVLEFFATTCSTCADQMAVLADARQRVDDSVRFLSVTSEPVGLSVSRADVREWWQSHDGTWPVGLDDGTALAQRYDATRVPTTLVLNDGVAWRHTGPFDADALVAAVDEVTNG
ncbi:TlpA family protein disulfide reductase [Haloarcula laminariae]|uniref:TlpA family protein disulfide reductase n=1 Tax=Haloarcula laminariae TaxID=2961577 RepID=UPI002405B755|nr:TlpA disulfide reductase family protein [Halomicroarcula sp. FL173]